MRPTVAEIDLSALIHNLGEVRKAAAGKKVLAVVKANAYGHGDVQVAACLERHGVDMLGVAMVEEGVRLRDAGIQTGIMVLGGVFADDLADCVTRGLTPVIYTTGMARRAAEAARSRGTVMNVHLKIDTGMGRIGVLPQDAVVVGREIAAMEGLRLEGILTHFAEADLADGESALEQAAIFEKTANELARQGVDMPLRHIANSAAVVTAPKIHLDMVRPGLMLYGCYPAPWMKGRVAVNLRPVMSIRSRVAYLKRIPAGAAVSYGRTFVARRDSLIATIPIGYADGYPRALSNSSDVLVRGKRAPVAGRVCMDMVMVDVTDIPGVEEGDIVTLMGQDGQEFIPADELAEKAGTISYEILCGIGSRVRRVCTRQ